MAPTRQVTVNANLIRQNKLRVFKSPRALVEDSLHSCNSILTAGALPYRPLSPTYSRTSQLLASWTVLAAGDPKDHIFALAEPLFHRQHVAPRQRPRGPLVAQRIDVVLEEIFPATA